MGSDANYANSGIFLMTPFEDAIAFAQAHEIPWPRDPNADPARWGVHHPDPPPFNRLLGPVHARGPQSGVILVNGKEVPDKIWAPIACSDNGSLHSVGTRAASLRVSVLMPFAKRRQAARVPI